MSLPTLPPDSLTESHHEPASPSERACLVAAARTLYLRQGIADTPLTDIGRACDLSESAVRRWFTDKATLAAAVVELHIHSVQQELVGCRLRSSTAVEELLALRSWVAEERKYGLFFRQLQLISPAGWQHWQAYVTSFLVEHLRNNLRWGMRQGLYYKNLQVESLADSWLQQTGLPGITPAGNPEAKSDNYLLLADFMAGIATPAGALVARRLQHDPPLL